MGLAHGDQFLAGATGDHFRQLVAEGVAHVEHTSHVTDHRLQCHGAEGGDLRHRPRRSALAYIDHAVAVGWQKSMSKSGIETVRIKKPLEEKRVSQWIQIGNSDGVGLEPAPEPRPGPTGTPLCFPQLMKSATMRK